MSPQSLFDTVPKEDTLSLFPDGKPNFEKVVDVLEFKKKDIAKASSVPVESVRFDDKMPKELYDRMTEWATAIALVGQHFKGMDKTVLWFKVQNPLLGNIAPREMIRVGRFPKLLRFIQNALNENQRQTA